MSKKIKKIPGYGSIIWDLLVDSIWSGGKKFVQKEARNLIEEIKIDMEEEGKD